MDGYILSEADAAELRALARERRQRVQNTRNRPGPDEDLSPAPDVYVARAPFGGIPAVSDFTPGSATCDVYRLLPNGTVLESTGISRVVHNLGPAIAQSTWIPVARDKYGSWYAQSSGSTSTTTTTTDAGACLLKAAGWQTDQCLTIATQAGTGTCSDTTAQSTPARWDGVQSAWKGAGELVTGSGGWLPLFDWPDTEWCCPRLRLIKETGLGTGTGTGSGIGDVVTMKFAGCYGDGLRFVTSDAKVCNGVITSSESYSICFSGFTGTGASLNVGMVAFTPESGSPGTWTGTLPGIGTATLSRTGTAPNYTFTLTVVATFGNVVFSGTSDGEGIISLAYVSGLSTAPSADLIAVPASLECPDNGLEVIVTCGCGDVVVPCCPKPLPRTMCLTVIEWMDGNAVTGGATGSTWGPTNYVFRSILFADRRVTLVYHADGVTDFYGNVYSGQLWYGEIVYAFNQSNCTDVPTAVDRYTFVLRCELVDGIYVWALYDRTGIVSRYQFTCQGCDPFALVSDRLDDAHRLTNTWRRVAVAPAGCAAQACNFQYPGTTASRGGAYLSPAKACGSNIVNGMSSTMVWFPSRLGDYSPSGPPNAGETVTSTWTVGGGTSTITFTLASGATLKLTGTTSGVDGTDCDWTWTFRSAVVTTGGTGSLGNWACYPFSTEIIAPRVADGGGVIVDDSTNLQDVDTGGTFKHSGLVASISTACTPGDTNGPPAPSWNCTSGGCVDPGDGTGTYSTIDACVAACGGGGTGQANCECGEWFPTAFGTVTPRLILFIPDGAYAGSYSGVWNGSMAIFRGGWTGGESTLVCGLAADGVTPEWHLVNPPVSSSPSYVVPLTVSCNSTGFTGMTFAGTRFGSTGQATITPA